MHTGQCTDINIVCYSVNNLYACIHTRANKYAYTCNRYCNMLLLLLLLLKLLSLLSYIYVYLYIVHLHMQKHTSNVFPCRDQARQVMIPCRWANTVHLSGVIQCFSRFLLIKAGWWYTYPSEKYDFVSWGMTFPTELKNKIHVPNHQPESHCQVMSVIP